MFGNASFIFIIIGLAKINAKQFIIQCFHLRCFPFLYLSPFFLFCFQCKVTNNSHQCLCVYQVVTLRRREDLRFSSGVIQKMMVGLFKLPDDMDNLFNDHHHPDYRLKKTVKNMKISTSACVKIKSSFAIFITDIQRGK